MLAVCDLCEYSLHAQLSAIKLTLDDNDRIQKDAAHNNTFAPRHISLKPDMYEAMVRTMHLPTRGIEGSALVGPCFWAAYDQDDDDQHLRKLTRIHQADVSPAH